MPDATAPTLALAAGPGAALWLSSRAGLPQTVEVLAARDNPWLGGCPSVTVDVWTTGAGARRLDSKTFRLADPWGWDEVWTPGSTLDCVGTTTLALGGHAGPLMFVLKDGGTGADLARSREIALGELPDGSADDEQPGWYEPGNPIGDAITEGRRTLRWVVVGAACVAAVVFAPTIKTALGALDGDE